jgi:hypothetical protein
MNIIIYQVSLFFKYINFISYFILSFVILRWVRKATGDVSGIFDVAYFGVRLCFWHC